MRTRTEESPLGSSGRGSTAGGSNSLSLVPVRVSETVKHKLITIFIILTVITIFIILTVITIFILLTVITIFIILTVITIFILLTVITVLITITLCCVRLLGLTVQTCSALLTAH